MKKLLDIGPYFANTYEPSLQLLDLYNPQQLTKTASAIESSAYKYASTMSPKEGHTYILVIAMGAGEYVGANRNGDYFPEKDLKLQYKNFETTYKRNPKTGEDEINGGALLYKHHKNKVAKGNPWFGTVHKAFYNDRMHRVELVIDVHHSQPGAMELVEKVNGGGDFAVSMGVNIPYDQCSRCHNKASKQEDYCDHLKYELGKTRDDGSRTYAINGGYDYNKYPRALNFFDISYVFRPADKTGYMLKKVASHNFEEHSIGSAEAFNKLAALQEKSAQLKKMADITKYFEGVPFAQLDSEDNPQLKVINRNPQVFDNVVSQMQELTPEHYNKLSKYPMGEILASLSDLGIMLSTPEFIKMIYHKKTGNHLDLLTLKQICKDQSSIFEELAANPEMVNELQAQMPMLNEEKFKPKDEIKDIVEDIKESRDLSPEGFAKKAAVSPLRSAMGWNDPANILSKDHYGMEHTEGITDPKTGKHYVASMGAIDEARRQRNYMTMAKVLGGAGLLAGAYSYLRSKKSGILGPALGIGALALGAKALYDKVNKDHNEPGYVTDSGMPIPRSTAMFTKESADTSWLTKFVNKTSPSARTAATLLPGAAAYTGHKYYQNRLQKGTAGTYRTPAEKTMDNFGRMAYTHPFLTTAGGMAAGHAGLNALSGLRKLFRR